MRKSSRRCPNPLYYDRDTQVAYVQQIEEGKLKASQAARDLGVAEQTIYNWIKSFVPILKPDCPEASSGSRMFDRGSQHCSHEYQQLLKDYNICCSMSRKAQCLDNACTETFFHSIKVERIFGKPSQSKYFTQKSIIEYISVFYNRQRLLSTLDYLPSCQFEANYHF